MIPMNLKVYKHKVCLLHITSKPMKMDFLVKEIGMKPDNARRFLEHSVDVKNDFLDLLEMVPLENHSLEDSIADFIYNYPMGSEPETMNETEINNCPIFYNEPLEYMDSSQYMFHGTPSWTEAFQLCYLVDRWNTSPRGWSSSGMDRWNYVLVFTWKLSSKRRSGN